MAPSRLRTRSGMRPMADSILTIGNHSQKMIGYEKNSATIPCLPLIQEGQLSVAGERMCTNGTSKLPKRLAREHF